jgi:hypothetical protein
LEHLSLQELCYGNLEGGVLYWGYRRICKERLWRWASLLMRALLGNVEGVFLLGTYM